jgi:hypothetical protein
MLIFVGPLTALAVAMPLARLDREAAVIGRLPDEMIVYCLAEGRQTRLVQAGTLLGTNRSGSTPQNLVLADGVQISVLTWPGTAPEGFDRTCRALWAADLTATTRIQPSGAGPRPIATGLLSGTAGAVLAFGLMEWRNVRDRRRAMGDRLRAAGAQFRRSVRVYVDQNRAAVTAHPDAVVCLGHRDDLRSEVTKVLFDLPDCASASRILTLLDDTAMIDFLTVARSPSCGDRSTAMGALTEWALRVEVGVEGLARMVERLPRRGVRVDGEVVRR